MHSCSNAFLMHIYNTFVVSGVLCLLSLVILHGLRPIKTLHVLHVGSPVAWQIRKQSAKVTGASESM